MENKAYRFGMLLFLFLLTGVLVAVSLYIGSVRISWKEIGSVLSGNSQDIVYRDIVMEIRFPRAVAAALLMYEANRQRRGGNGKPLAVHSSITWISKKSKSIVSTKLSWKKRALAWRLNSAMVASSQIGLPKSNW